MSQNAKSENQRSIHDEVHLIYKNNNHVDERAERVTDPISEHLYFISDSITHTRESFLESQSNHHETVKRGFFSAAFNYLFKQDNKPKIETEKSLRRKEYAIGAKLYDYGIPNERREFHNDNRMSWFYYVEKTDLKNNLVMSETIHLEVHPKAIRIILVKNGQGIENQHLNGKSLDNFILATGEYHERVMREVYGIEPTDSKKA